MGHSTQNAQGLAPWNEETADAGLARWDQVCRQEGWGRVPRNRDLLRALFGASWYLTRFLFYSGRESALLLDMEDMPPQAEAMHHELHQAVADAHDWLHTLRTVRNRMLLRLTLADLLGELTQEVLEERLSILAQTVLHILLERCGLDDLVALGMGRLAVQEMNYGSDLDLILLYSEKRGGHANTIGKLLRHCQAAEPPGKLYDIDVRLRPHGQAGTLISGLDAFESYHLDVRETWERQAMTRCRPIHDRHGSGRILLDKLRQSIYGCPDVHRLRKDIASLRTRVERELGSPRGYWELKRGYGGLMDIDFLAHWLQLRHGAVHTELQGAGTRHTLRVALQCDLLDPRHAHLLDCYEFLKRMEGRLRLFDMRPLSRFSHQSLPMLAQAMGMGSAADPPAALQETYELQTQAVRSAFIDVVGGTPQAS